MKRDKTQDRRWTGREIDYAIEQRLKYRTPLKLIAKALNRTRRAVSEKLRLLGVVLQHRGGPGVWDRLVRANCKPGLTDEEVAIIIGTSRTQVGRVRRRLGIPRGVTQSEANRQNNYLRWAYHNARKLQEKGDGTRS